MNAYQFEINRNGYYSVWRGVNDNWIGLQHWTYTSAIRRGDSSNTLRVLMIGSRMNLFINGTLVWVGNDTKLGSGQVGAFIAREGSRTTNDSLQVSSAKLTIPGASLLSELPAISTAQESLNAQGNSAKQGTLSEGTK